MSVAPEKNIPEPILETIREAENVVLFTHVHPDGDALGSLFGFASVLESLGKNTFCFLQEPVSYLYDFLPEIERGRTSLEDYQQFLNDHGESLISIGLDCGDSDRLGKYKDEFLSRSPFIVIDHHRSHRDFGDLRWVDDSRSSTGEMVFEIATQLKAKINYPCAYNLYVAICTDTGSFRYESTSARTMEIAGKLLSAGVKPNEVGNHLYDNYSISRLRLMEMVLSTLAVNDSGKIATMLVTSEMIEKSGAALEDVEGFIDLPRSLKSAKVAVLVKETPKEYIAVSLRAKGDCDVAAIAKRFDGGGHRNAAGFRCHNRSAAEVRDLVIREIRTELAG